MQVNGKMLTGLTVLALAGCSQAEDGRSAAKLALIEWTLESSGQTVIGETDIAYDGAQVKDVTFRVNGTAAGRMEFRYSGARVNGIDVTDAEGDQGTYAWNYAEGRLSSIIWSVPQVVSHEQEFEYDDAAGGRARRVTSTTTWVGTTPSSTVETYDYDAKGRLEEIAAVQGSSSWSTEIRYDAESRIERITRYVDSDFTDTDLTYDDDGRLSRVESNDQDRYEITYNADGQIEEIFVLAPSSGQTLTATYSYVAGNVDGLTFNPNLPVSGLVDLRGLPFDQPEFTAMAPPFDVGDVPAVEPTNPPCAHDECTAGAALATTCSSCAESVCAQDSYCCSSGWDSTCVSLAETTCGLDCGGGTTTCTHDVCTVGTALEGSCGSCEQTICNYDSYCCTSSWDATCVGYVSTQCGFSC